MDLKMFLSKKSAMFAINNGFPLRKAVGHIIDGKFEKALNDGDCQDWYPAIEWKIFFDSIKEIGDSLLIMNHENTVYKRLFIAFVDHVNDLHIFFENEFISFDLRNSESNMINESAFAIWTSYIFEFCKLNDVSININKIDYPTHSTYAWIAKNKKQYPVAIEESEFKTDFEAIWDACYRCLILLTRKVKP